MSISIFAETAFYTENIVLPTIFTIPFERRHPVNMDTDRYGAVGSAVGGYINAIFISFEKTTGAETTRVRYSKIPFRTRLFCCSFLRLLCSTKSGFPVLYDFPV